MKKIYTLFMATILLFTICDNSFAQLCFSPVSNYQMSSSYNVTSVASADFNGDGKQDLTVANANTGWMIVRPGTGVGTFGPTIYSTPPIASGYTHVISSDFNVDGKMDVAMVTTSGGSVSVLLGDGTGNFPTKTDYFVGNNFPISVV